MTDLKPADEELLAQDMKEFRELIERDFEEQGMLVPYLDRIEEDELIFWSIVVRRFIKKSLTEALSDKLQ